MGGQGQSARLAKFELAMRRQRRLVFGDNVSPPGGWDIIIVLYIADTEGERLTVRETIERTGGCPEVGKRWVAHLSRTGVVVGDGYGRVDDVVTLAPETITRIEEMIDHIWQRIRSA